MSVRLVSLAVFALAAFIAFGDVLISHAHSSPETFINDVGRSFGNAVTSVAGWFGLS